MKLTLFILAVLAFLLLTLRSQAMANYVEGEVIVTFKPGETMAAATNVLRKKSLSFAEHYRTLSEKRNRQTGLVREKSKTTAQLIAELKDDPGVETVEPNYLRWVNGTPNDARFGEQWALNNTGQSINGTAGTA